MTLINSSNRSNIRSKGSKSVNRSRRSSISKR